MPQCFFNWEESSMNISPLQWLFQNNTAGYHRHILRLPIFVKKAFKKMKTFFFSKKHFVIFSNFSNFQNSKFPKKLISRAEKKFLRNNTIWYAFYSKFGTFIEFWKIQVFEKNPSILFFQKNPNFERFEKTYYFSCILRQICYNWVKK